MFNNNKINCLKAQKIKLDTYLIELVTLVIGFVEQVKQLIIKLLQKTYN